MVKKKVGRPTKYNQEILDKTKAYYLRFKEAEPVIQVTSIVNNKEVLNEISNPDYYKPPYLEELALDLDIDDETIIEWSKIHPNFSATIKRIKSLQKVRLLNSTMNKNSNVGAIFQLKCNHGMIETEKRQVDITSGGKAFNVGVVSYKEASGNGHKK